MVALTQILGTIKLKLNGVKTRYTYLNEFGIGTKEFVSTEFIGSNCKRALKNAENVEIINKGNNYKI